MVGPSTLWKRENGLDGIKKALEAAREGHGGPLFLVGEAGRSEDVRLTCRDGAWADAMESTLPNL